MLHNPHLGLTEMLQKLYDLAKSMAVCVVPQEYGITIEEKRDIGSKMCHTLLEKINYDLAIARTDNLVDMQYLINMDYSAQVRYLGSPSLCHRTILIGFRVHYCLLQVIMPHLFTWLSYTERMTLVDSTLRGYRRY